MPSPFPGMDPWLEHPDLFPDLHARLVTHLSEALNVLLPDQYIATTKSMVWVDDVQRREPDVSVYDAGPEHTAKGSVATAVATLAGLTALGEFAPPEPWEQPYLEIVSTQGRRLVTAIEVVSRSNKQDGNGRAAYRAKQQEFYLGDVNLVEIDLLRSGPHVTMIPPNVLDRLGRGVGYHIAVTTPRQQYGTLIQFTDPLPRIGIPLKPADPPVVVDLQPLLDRVYDTGRYSRLIDYRSPCDPPLTVEQQAWANGLLAGRGI